MATGSIPRLGEPHLFGRERELMDRAFAAGCRRYSEFGLGGSTLLALRSGAEQVVAVDSDPRWVAAVHEHPEVRQAVQAGSASVFHADIGPTGDWGYPVSTESARQWPNYLRTAWAEWAVRGALPDLVYVDGRFRVACCLSVALAFASDTAAASRVRVLLHDVGDDRPHYAPVFNVLDTVEAVGTLQYLKLKAKVCTATVLQALLAYQYDAR